MKVPSFFWLLNHPQQPTNPAPNPFENQATSDPLDTPVGAAPFAEPPDPTPLAESEPTSELDEPVAELEQAEATITSQEANGADPFTAPLAEEVPSESSPFDVPAPESIVDTEMPQVPDEITPTEENQDSPQAAETEPFAPAQTEDEPAQSEATPSGTNPFDTPAAAPADPELAPAQNVDPFQPEFQPTPDPIVPPTDEMDSAPPNPFENPAESTPGMTGDDPFQGNEETDLGSEETAGQTGDESSTESETDELVNTTKQPSPPPVNAAESNWLAANWEYLLPLLLIPILLFGLWRWLAGRRTNDIVENELPAIEVERKPDFPDAFGDTIEGANVAVSGFAADAGTSSMDAVSSLEQSLETAASHSDEFNFSDATENQPVVAGDTGQVDSEGFSFSNLDEEDAEDIVQPVGETFEVGLPDLATNSDESVDQIAGIDESSLTENSDTFSFDDDDEFDAPAIEIDNTLESETKNNEGISAATEDSAEFGFADLDDSVIEDLGENGETVERSTNFELDNSPDDVFSLTADESIEDLIDDGMDQIAFDPVEEANAIQEAEIAQAEIDAALDMADETTNGDAADVNAVFGNDAIENKVAGESGPALNLDDDDEDMFQFDEEELAFDDEPVEGIIDDRPQDSIGNDSDLEFDFSEDDEFAPAGFALAAAELSDSAIAIEPVTDAPVFPDLVDETHSNGSPTESESEQNNHALVGAVTSLSESFTGDAIVESEIELDDVTLDSDVSPNSLSGMGDAAPDAFGLTTGSHTDDSSNVRHKRELAGLRAQVDLLRNENGRLESEVAIVRNDSTTTIENFENAINEKEIQFAHRLTVAESRISEFEPKLETVRQQLTEREQALGEKEAALQEKETAKRALAESVDSAISTQELNDQIADLKQNLDAVEQDREESKELFQEVQSQLSETKEQLSESNNQLESVNKQITCL